MKTVNLPKMADMRKMFPYLYKEELKYLVTNNSYKTCRGFLNDLNKINSEYSKRANMPDVKKMTVYIVWKNNSNWGLNPTASVYWLDVNDENHCLEEYARASGCGYDKESTVFAKCCNAVLSGMLFRRKRGKDNIPYGITYGNYFPTFEAGVGMSCYNDIAIYLGGELEHVVHRSNYDRYEITFNNKKGRL